mmetsp:Transcript_142/g.254  ORF Transcript_142/g.254 Transcript_142/m.254 type:complete len:222 (+) Transcript_142:597-1262(+)
MFGGSGAGGPRPAQSPLYISVFICQGVGSIPDSIVSPASGRSGPNAVASWCLISGSSRSSAFLLLDFPSRDIAIRAATAPSSIVSDASDERFLRDLEQLAFSFTLSLCDSFKRILSAPASSKNCLEDGIFEREYITCTILDKTISLGFISSINTIRLDIVLFAKYVRVLTSLQNRQRVAASTSTHSLSCPRISTSSTMSGNATLFLESMLCAVNAYKVHEI